VIGGDLCAREALSVRGMSHQVWSATSVHSVTTEDPMRILGPLSGARFTARWPTGDKPKRDRVATSLRERSSGGFYQVRPGVFRI
jgi:hypothetical protein